MKCNYCWKDVRDDGYVTQCSHLFCQICAEMVFSKTIVCPICNTTLESTGIAAIELNNEKANSLLGSSPRCIIEATLRALEFWSSQVLLELEKERKARNTIASQVLNLERNIREKDDKNEMLSRRVEQLETENSRYKQDHTILQEKYQERSNQKQKLEELYERLKHRSEDEQQRSSLFGAHSNANVSVESNQSKPRQGLLPLRSNRTGTSPTSDFDISSLGRRTSTLTSRQSSGRSLLTSPKDRFSLLRPTQHSPSTSHVSPTRPDTTTHHPVDLTSHHSSHYSSDATNKLSSFSSRHNLTPTRPTTPLLLRKTQSNRPR